MVARPSSGHRVGRAPTRTRARAGSRRARDGAGRRSGIAARTSAATTKRRRSRASSIAGRRNATSPSRCPVDCPTRYGIRQNTTPPTSAAGRETSSVRSHQHVSGPASTNVRSTTRSYDQTFPNRAASGQYGRPSSQPWRFGGAWASGRKEYGSAGARRRARADDRRARSSSRAAGGRRRPPLRARPRGGRGSAPRRAGSPARSPRARRPSTARAPRERSGCDRRPRGDDRIGRRPLELATHCCKRSSRSTTPGRAESRSASGTARRRSTPCGCACRPT